MQQTRTELFNGTLEALGSLGLNKAKETVWIDAGILGQQQCVARFRFEDGGIVIESIHFGQENVTHMIGHSDMDDIIQQIEDM